MQKFIIVLLILIVGLNPAIAQTVGKPAPAVLFSSALNKHGITPESLENKYIVLDFWATWCGPCVASFSHLNELSGKFGSDSVVFAIISSEEKNKVTKFLSNRSVNALHLIDSITEDSRKNSKINDLYGLTAQSFAVYGIPHTVVIDKYGFLRWVGSARQLTPVILMDILSGKAAKVQEDQFKQKASIEKARALRNQTIANLRKDTVEGENYKLVIAKSPYNIDLMSAGRKEGKRFVEFGGRKMGFLYWYFTRNSFFRTKNSLPDKDSGYFMRFEMDTSYSTEEFNSTALSALAKACHLSFEKIEVSQEVWTLRIQDPKKFLKNSMPLDATSRHRSSDSNDKELFYNNFSLATIIGDLEDELKIFIEVEENELNKKVADFKIPKGNPEFVSKQLWELYGIKMTKGIKETTMTEIK